MYPLSRSSVIAARRILPVVGVVAGFAILVHGVNMGAVALALRNADWRWLAAGVALSGLALAGSIVVWTAFVRDRAPQIGRGTLALWHMRSLLASQVVPTGAGGDAVRGLAVTRLAGGGVAIGSLAMGRVMAALAMATWGLAGGALLHDSVGIGPVVAGAVGVVAMVTALMLALHADLILCRLGRRQGRLSVRVHAALTPMAATLGSWRQRPALVSMALLTALAGWGLNLAALTLLGRAVGIEVGWQIFAVTIPLTLAATWLPVAANGIGVREGILVGLLVHAGVASGAAMALSILVDLQMLPFALIGGLLWLRGAGATTPVGAVSGLGEAVPVLA